MIRQGELTTGSAPTDLGSAVESALIWLCKLGVGYGFGIILSSHWSNLSSLLQPHNGNLGQLSLLTRCSNMIQREYEEKMKLNSQQCDDARRDSSYGKSSNSFPGLEVENCFIDFSREAACYIVL